MVNFCTISIKYSYLHFVSILGLTFITILLMTSANCAILYKLPFILTLLLAMVYLIYQINNFSNNSKVDFLFDINSLIIWKNNSSQIYEIVDGCNLSSWYIVIKIRFKNNQQTLIIPRFSCDNKQYKHLMRNVLWNSINNN